MRIGRFTTQTGRALWGTWADDAHVAPLPADLGTWATRAARGELPTPTDEAHIPTGELRPVAPLAPGARILGVGANYRAHLERLGAEPPDAPVAFLKPASAIVGPDEEIAYPGTTEQLDYEIELVAVMAGPVRPGTPPSSALLGFTVGNDVSARDARSPLGGPDLFAMKALDRTTPVGPWITTADEFASAAAPGVHMALAVNGEVRQRDHTDEMIFSLDRLLGHLDQRVALAAGDLVFTGTTCGVGLEDGRFLRPGDVVDATVDRIGTLHNVVGPRASSR